MNRLVIVGLSAALSTASIPRQAASREFPLGACLTAYAAHDYERALQPIATAADIEHAYDALATTGTAWIHADPSDLPHRRLVAASFSLEVAGLRQLATSGEKHAIAEVMVDLDRRGRLAQLLVAWGAAALTAQSPIFPTYAKIMTGGRVTAVKAARASVPVQPAEREWFRAAAVTLEGGGWSTLLDVSHEQPTGLTGVMGNMATPPAFPLLPLALARVPNDPLLLLVGANAELQHDTLMMLPTATGPLPMKDYVRSPRSTWSEAALKHYKALANTPEVSGEALLYAGFIEVRLGHSANGRRDLAEADRLTKDPQVQYVSRLLTGTTWQLEHRPDEAERSYRGALEAVPHARSASSLLAALLTNTNRMAEASSILDGAQGPAQDPWMKFGTGFDGRFLPELMAALRAGLR